VRPIQAYHSFIWKTWKKQVVLTWSGKNQENEKKLGETGKE